MMSGVPPSLLTHIPEPHPLHDLMGAWAQVPNSRPGPLDRRAPFGSMAVR
jgi:hypothetical protein